MTIRPKYHQGTVRSKWKIHQCQGEKVYFGARKNCGHCPGQHYCYTIKVKPFAVDVHNKVMVFAETEEDASKYVAKGHGHDLSDYKK